MIKFKIQDLFIKYITYSLSMCFLIMSCSENESFYNYEEQDSIKLTINIDLDCNTISYSNNSISTRATQTNLINDITIYIFDSNGNTIGWASKDLSSGSTSTSLTITTRKASNCTIYAIANGTDKISITNRNKIPTKKDFDNLYYKYSNTNNIPTNPILFGSKSGVEINTQNISLTLSNLYSTYSFNIKINKDQATNMDIVMDSYQLLSIPLGLFVSQTKTATDYYDESVTTLSSNNDSGNTITFTRNFLPNKLDNGSNPNSKGWGDRSKTYAPNNATYLAIKCHSQQWESTYYYYIGGKNLPATFTTGCDYTDYSIYPSCSYSANIEINGNGASEDGSRVSVIIKSIKSDDLGRVMCADGTIYNTVDEAKKANKEPIGMIGYVGPNTGNSTYCHGLVFALENAGEVTEGDYDTAVEFAKTYKSAALKFSSGWHIPTLEEWCRMFEAFEGTKYKVITEDMMQSIGDGLYNVNEPWLYGETMNKMEQAGGEPFHYGSNYAAKTTFMGSEGFWIYSFSEKIWGWRTNKFNRAVRLCFAF